MSVTFKILYVKPETTKWYGDLNPENHSFIQNTIKTFEGVIDYVRIDLDENMIESTITFESEEAFTNYKKLWSIPPWTERKEYNDQNLIVSFITESRD